MLIFFKFVMVCESFETRSGRQGRKGRCVLWPDSLVIHMRCAAGTVSPLAGRRGTHCGGTTVFCKR